MSFLDRIIKGKKATRVGIDISSTTVKLLELSESNGGFRVLGRCLEAQLIPTKR